MSFCAAAFSLSLLGCGSPAFQAAETVLTKAGCELVAVLAGGGEEVGTLCAELAPAVEAELAKLFAGNPGPLLAHRAVAHRKRARLRDHFPGRDPSETIEEGLPLEAALRVLRRRAVAAR